ncbi:MULTISPECIES: YdcF family protein [unclassified Caulobacter]|uniref:YdcF family protein n=1 Tax=unclassified Caulobacter TaxID=2648921 RepID=UPI000D33359A|nr:MULTISPECIES: YdcF family protein [unclassified Caulobacter]PTS90876.1 YdcF family protein [Caulobacter sp. HMWF009]PTT05353.1 YdcF family protein [Caulobacter sp. HMWF025]
MKGAAALLIAALVWAVGLLAFSGRVERSVPAAEPPVADGVVVLTGASNIRLEAATRLLEAGKGKRLLISGVNREATRDDVLNVTKAVKPIYDCCVDLGFTAADTIGNAAETAEWARAKDYDSLIVVTADYHMPRSMLELHAAMPGIRLYAYPVATEGLDARHWWKKGSTARRMTVEYCKYLAILAREAFLKLGPKG